MQSQTDGRLDSFNPCKDRFTVGFVKGPNEGMGNILQASLWLQPLGQLFQGDSKLIERAILDSQRSDAIEP